MYSVILKRGRRPLTPPTLHAIDRYLRLLESAYRIQMSSKEFRLFDFNEKDFSTLSTLAFVNRELADRGCFADMVPSKNILEDGKKLLRRFYGSVNARDRAFVRNTQRIVDGGSWMVDKSTTHSPCLSGRQAQSTLRTPKAAILIAGGYHTAHLKKLFKEKGWSYVVLTPNVTSETSQKKYEEVLLEPLRGLTPHRPSPDRGLTPAVSGVRALPIFEPLAAARLASLRNEASAWQHGTGGARLASITGYTNVPVTPGRQTSDVTFDAVWGILKKVYPNQEEIFREAHDVYESTVYHYQENLKLEQKRNRLNDEEIRISQVGKLLNNWFIKIRPEEQEFPRQKPFSEKIVELISTLSLNNDAINEAVSAIQAHRNSSNPAQLDLDRLTRPVIYALLVQGYSMSRLFAARLSAQDPNDHSEPNRRYLVNRRDLLLGGVIFAVSLSVVCFVYRFLEVKEDAAPPVKSIQGPAIVSADNRPEKILRGLREFFRNSDRLSREERGWVNEFLNVPNKVFISAGTRRDKNEAVGAAAVRIDRAIEGPDQRELTINTDVFEQLLRLAKTDRFYRMALRALVIKEGSTLADMKKRPAVYLALTAPRGGSEAEIVDLAGKLIDLEAVGYRAVLRHFRRVGVRRIPRRKIQAEKNDRVIGQLRRWDSLLQSSAGGEEAIRVNIFNHEIQSFNRGLWGLIVKKGIREGTITGKRKDGGIEWTFKKGALRFLRDPKYRRRVQPAGARMAGRVKPVSWKGYPPHIVLVTPEARPFAKRGGLGDSAAEQAAALARLGLEDGFVSLFMPDYRHSSNGKSGDFDVRPTDIEYSAPVAGVQVPGAVRQAMVNGVYYWLLGATNQALDYTHHLYDTTYNDTSLRQAVFFSRSVMKVIPELVRGGLMPKPDVIHANDWLTALVPILGRMEHAGWYLDPRNDLNDPLSRAKYFYRIHNAGPTYQGQFPDEWFDILGLTLSDPTQYARDFALRGGFNLTRAAIALADGVDAVSKGYGDEIMGNLVPTGGLDEIAKRRHDEGAWHPIANGLDKGNGNGSGAYRGFETVREMEKIKPLAKAELQRRFDLNVDENVPIISMIARLDPEQKGTGLVRDVLQKTLDLGAQVIIFNDMNGFGDEKANFRNLAHYLWQSGYGGQFRFYLNDSDDRLDKNPVNLDGYEMDSNDKLIYAGSDLFIVPSRTEPFGLTPPIAMLYGTVPIVRKTGGLQDTVQVYDAGRHPTGNGFIFEGYNHEEFLGAIAEALSVYKNSNQWKHVVENALNSKYSWDMRVQEFGEYYLTPFERMLRHVTAEAMKFVSPAERMTEARRRFSELKTAYPFLEDHANTAFEVIASPRRGGRGARMAGTYDRWFRVYLDSDFLELSGVFRPISGPNEPAERRRYQDIQGEEAARVIATLFAVWPLGDGPKWNQIADHDYFKNVSASTRAYLCRLVNLRKRLGRELGAAEAVSLHYPEKGKPFLIFGIKNRGETNPQTALIVGINLSNHAVSLKSEPGEDGMKDFVSVDVKPLFSPDPNKNYRLRDMAPHLPGEGQSLRQYDRSGRQLAKEGLSIGLRPYFHRASPTVHIFKMTANPVENLPFRVDEKKTDTDGWLSVNNDRVTSFHTPYLIGPDQPLVVEGVLFLDGVIDPRKIRDSLVIEIESNHTNRRQRYPANIISVGSGNGGLPPEAVFFKVRFENNTMVPGTHRLTVRARVKEDSRDTYFYPFGRQKALIHVPVDDRRHRLVGSSERNLEARAAPAQLGVGEDFRQAFVTALSDALGDAMKTGAIFASSHLTDGIDDPRSVEGNPLYGFTWMRDACQFAAFLARRAGAFENARLILNKFLDYLYQGYGATHKLNAQRLGWDGLSEPETNWGDQSDGPAHAAILMLDLFENGLLEAGSERERKALFLLERAVEAIRKNILHSILYVRGSRDPENDPRDLDAWEEFHGKHAMNDILYYGVLKRMVSAARSREALNGLAELAGRPYSELEQGQGPLDFLEREVLPIYKGRPDTWERPADYLLAHRYVFNSGRLEGPNGEKPTRLDAQTIFPYTLNLPEPYHGFFDPAILETYVQLDDVFARKFALSPEQTVRFPRTVLWGRYPGDKYGGLAFTEAPNDSGHAWVITTLWAVLFNLKAIRKILDERKIDINSESFRKFINHQGIHDVNTSKTIFPGDERYWQIVGALFQRAQDTLNFLRDLAPKGKSFSEQIERYEEGGRVKFRMRGASALNWSNWTFAMAVLEFEKIRHELDTGGVLGARLAGAGAARTRRGRGGNAPPGNHQKTPPIRPEPRSREFDDLLTPIQYAAEEIASGRVGPGRSVVDLRDGLVTIVSDSGTLPPPDLWTSDLPVFDTALVTFHTPRGRVSRELNTVELVLGIMDANRIKGEAVSTRGFLEQVTQNIKRIIDEQEAVIGDFLKSHPGESAFLREIQETRNTAAEFVRDRTEPEAAESDNEFFSKLLVLSGVVRVKAKILAELRETPGRAERMADFREKWPRVWNAAFFNEYRTAFLKYCAWGLEKISDQKKDEAVPEDFRKNILRNFLLLELEPRMTGELEKDAGPVRIDERILRKTGSVGILFMNPDGTPVQFVAGGGALEHAFANEVVFRPELVPAWHRPRQNAAFIYGTSGRFFSVTQLKNIFLDMFHLKRLFGGDEEVFLGVADTATGRLRLFRPKMAPGGNYGGWVQSVADYLKKTINDTRSSERDVAGPFLAEFFESMSVAGFTDVPSPYAGLGRVREDILERAGKSSDPESVAFLTLDRLSGWLCKEGVQNPAGANRSVKMELARGLTEELEKHRKAERILNRLSALVFHILNLRVPADTEKKSKRNQDKWTPAEFNGQDRETIEKIVKPAVSGWGNILAAISGFSDERWPVVEAAIVSAILAVRLEQGLTDPIELERWKSILEEIFSGEPDSDSASTHYRKRRLEQIVRTGLTTAARLALGGVKGLPPDALVAGSAGELSNQRPDPSAFSAVLTRLHDEGRLSPEAFTCLETLYREQVSESRPDAARLSLSSRQAGRVGAVWQRLMAIYSLLASNAVLRLMIKIKKIKLNRMERIADKHKHVVPRTGKGARLAGLSEANQKSGGVGAAGTADPLQKAFRDELLVLFGEYQTALQLAYLDAQEKRISNIRLDPETKKALAKINELLEYAIQDNCAERLGVLLASLLSITVYSGRSGESSGPYSEKVGEIESIISKILIDRSKIRGLESGARLAARRRFPHKQYSHKESLRREALRREFEEKRIKSQERAHREGIPDGVDDEFPESLLPEGQSLPRALRRTAGARLVNASEKARLRQAFLPVRLNELENKIPYPIRIGDGAGFAARSGNNIILFDEEMRPVLRFHYSEADIVAANLNIERVQTDRGLTAADDRKMLSAVEILERGDEETAKVRAAFEKYKDSGLVSQETCVVSIDLGRLPGDKAYLLNELLMLRRISRLPAAKNFIFRFEGTGVDRILKMPLAATLAAEGVINQDARIHPATGKPYRQLALATPGEINSWTAAQALPFIPAKPLDRGELDSEADIWLAMFAASVDPKNIPDGFVSLYRSRLPEVDWTDLSFSLHLFLSGDISPNTRAAAKRLALPPLFRAAWTQIQQYFRTLQQTAAWA
ncbi:MAG: glycogen/starch synthase [Candidatus Omnitrophica bacterium]|nr:glycogen/starch synthase [Candidatus Omnitrophota bacterium]